MEHFECLGAEHDFKQPTRHSKAYVKPINETIGAKRQKWLDQACCCRVKQVVGIALVKVKRFD